MKYKKSLRQIIKESSKRDRKISPHDLFLCLPVMPEYNIKRLVKIQKQIEKKKMEEKNG